jgi:hypothetical protein
MSGGLKLILASMIVVLSSAETRLAHADYVTVSYQSQPGDPVGRGQTFDYTYTPANQTPNGGFSINYSPYNYSLDLGMVSGDPSKNTYTNLIFSTLQLGTPLQVGTYTDALQYQLFQPGHPGLDVGFQNREAETLTGSFTVNSLSYFTNSSNVRVLGSFDVNFEQHAEGMTAALLGHLVYQNTSVVPEPSSLALCGIAGLSGLGYAWRRRKPAPVA